MAPSEYCHIYACPSAVHIDLPDFIPSFNAQTLTLGKIFLLWGQPDTGTGFPVTQLMLCPSEYSRFIWTMPLLMAFDFWLVLMCSGGWTLWYSKIPTNQTILKHLIFHFSEIKEIILQSTPAKTSAAVQWQPMLINAFCSSVPFSARLRFSPQW